MTWSRWLDNDDLINDEDIDTDKECAYDVDIDHDAGEEDLHDDIDHDEDIYQLQILIKKKIAIILKIANILKTLIMMQERRICMTIPQQECTENVVEKCDLVPRYKDDLVLILPSLKNATEELALCSPTL